MPSFIASLANSYQERQIYLAEAATPAVIKWQPSHIGLLHRVFAVAFFALLQVGTLFSSTWQNASHEIWARIVDGTVFRRKELAKPHETYQSLNIPINNLPGIANDFHKLGLLLPSEMEMGGTEEMSMGMGVDKQVEKTWPLFDEPTTFNKPKPSSIKISTTQGPQKTTPPPFQYSMPSYTKPAPTLPFKQTSITSPTKPTMPALTSIKAKAEPEAPARFTVIKDPESDAPELLIPSEKPQLLEYYLQKGWEVVPVKVTPKIDAFTAQVIEWRNKVYAAQSSLCTITGSEGAAHNEILPNLFLGGNISPTTTYNLDKAIVPSSPKYDTIISVISNAASGPLQAGFRYSFPTSYGGDVNAESFTADSVSKALSYIDEALRQNKRVLVHCQLGQSRSPSIVAMYIAVRTGVTLEQAIKYMKSKRGNASPNSNYIAKHNIIRPQVEAILKAEGHPFKMIDFKALESV